MFSLQIRFNYDTIREVADAIKIEDFAPLVGIICGTGLGLLADKIKIVKRVPFEEIPYFTKPTVQGHAGEFIFGELGNVKVICMKGRFHFYEGYSIKKVISRDGFYDQRLLSFWEQIDKTLAD